MKNFVTHFWQIGKISFPLTLATASATLLVFIDSLFATRISIPSYEAVFLTIPIMGVATGVGIGLAAAIADLISKEKALIQIKRLITASFMLSFISMLLFFYFAIFQTDMIERVAGLSALAENAPIKIEFRSYWKIILWTFPMQILFALTIQYLTILEKQKAGMLIVLFLLILNVVLDYTFSMALPWGVQGLAYSTMGVFSAGVLLSFIPLRQESYFQKPFPTLFDRMSFKALGKLSFLTLLIFLTIVIFSISGIILNKLALQLAAGALVTFAIFRQIMEVIILTSRGLSGGFIIYLGNAFRDKATSEYFPIYWAATAWIAIVNMTGVILMLVFPDTLINFFDNIDPNLIPDIKYIFIIGAVILFIFILPRMGQIGFISLGKTGLLVMCSVVFVTVQITCAYLWINTYGVNGLVYAELAAGIANSLFILPLFFYYLNQAKKKDNPTNV